MSKKALTLFAVFLLGSFHLKCQWYFTPAVGYALGVQGADYNYTYGNSMDDRRVGNTSLSYHKGWMAKAGFGCSLNEWAAVELTAGYQNSFKSNSLSYYYYQQWSSHRNTVEVFWKSQSFSLTPTLLLGNLRRHGPFLRTGPTFQYVMCRDETGFYPLNKNVGWYSQEVLTKYEAQVIVGIFAEAGFYFALGEKLGLTLSAAYQGLAYHPQRAEISSLKDETGEPRTIFYQESVSVEEWEDNELRVFDLRRKIALNSITPQVSFIFHL